MSISVKPTMKCSLSCTYCYENEMRDSGNETNEYDIAKIINQAKIQMEQQGSPLTLHGGEPLLIKKKDLESLFKESFDKFGNSSIQTNGELIDQDHIEMFIKYNVNVGISMDGFDECNLGRWKGSVGSTLRYTRNLWDTIRKLRDKKISVFIISVVSRKNGLLETRDTMKRFILDLKSIGIYYGRFNPVEVDIQELKEEFELTPKELKDFWLDMSKFTMEAGVHWGPFRDIVDNFLGLDKGSCIFTPCDWYHTDAETSIMENGNLANCLKTAKEGFATVRVDHNPRTQERYEILQQIKVEDGGCGGCPFWNICFGLCPAESGDWRGKSKYCESYFELYKDTEIKLKSIMPNLILVNDPNYKAVHGTKYGAFDRILNDQNIGRSTWKNPVKMDEPTAEGKFVKGGLLNE